MNTGSVEVPAALDGERVDRALALVTGRSRAEVARTIASGAVRLDGEVVLSRHVRVRTGARLEFELAPTRVGDDALVAEEVPFGVVYEDADIVVVDKPAGIVVHPGSGRSTGTLAAGLVGRFPDLVAAGGAGAGGSARPGIVHRLDKDTSGLLVVARTPAAWQTLTEQLARREMGRGYVALALRKFDAEEASIDAPIGRSPRDRTRMAVAVDGRPARTRYRVVAAFHTPLDAALLDVDLETGRTHQIRVHLAAIGHPVAGDARYKGALSPALREATGIRRPFLHASRLRLVHPSSGEEMKWESPLPDDLARALDHFS